MPYFPSPHLAGLLVPSLLVLSALPSPLGASESAAALPPSVFDAAAGHGFLWWRKGERAAAPERIYEIETDRYALSVDTAGLRVAAFVPTLPDARGPSAERGIATRDRADAPEADLRCRLLLRGKAFPAVPSSPRLEDVQLIECGRYFQRRWHGVTFPGGPDLQPADTGLEVSAWPDRVSFVLRATSRVDLAETDASGGVLEMILDLGVEYDAVLEEGTARALARRRSGRASERDSSLDSGRDSDRVSALASGFVFLASDGTTRLEIDADRRRIRAFTSLGTWAAGVERSVGIVVHPAALGIAQVLEAVAREDAEALTVEAEQVLPSRAALAVSRDRDRGWQAIALRNDGAGSDEDKLSRTRLTLRNPGDSPRTARLCFEKDAKSGMYNEPGYSLLLRDRDLYPTGIPVQISKNWHVGRVRERFQGPWLHGLAMFTVPPRSTLELDLAIANQNWGGVPAASHAQLCLVGWGYNQQWDEAAVGAWGETWCYEPEGGQAQALGTDSRPLLVLTPEGKAKSWTGNVGGFDFLRVFDASGARRWHRRIRTLYRSHGPNLTSVTYAGETDDGALEYSFRTQVPRTDDLARDIHRFRIDVRADCAFRRLVIWQVAADSYNYGASSRLAIGSIDRLAPERQWAAGSSANSASDSDAASSSGSGSPGHPRALLGRAPWASFHDSASPADQFRPANRGFVIRSWRARIGGRDDVPPHVVESIVRTREGGRRDGSNLDLVPPLGVNSLRKGDFIEAEIVRLVLPRHAEDYYGPNRNLRRALELHGDTPILVLREAVGNDLEIEALAGTLESIYPVRIRTRANAAELRIAGGLGHVPIAFTGLDDYRAPILEREEGGVWKPVDQSRHGKDYWQCDRDFASGTWEIGFNLPLDAEEYQDLEALKSNPPRRSFRFRLEPSPGPRDVPPTERTGK